MTPSLLFAAATALAELPWIHLANVVYLVSYSVRDILALRALTVAAALCLLPYYGLHGLWAAIAWNVLFTAVNVVQIVRIVRERWPIELQGLDREVYERSFSILTPNEFARLAALGEWRELSAGADLVVEGERVLELMVLATGTAEVRHGGRADARLDAGQFIGEMSFLTRERASASVAVTTDATILCWSQEQLQSFLRDREDLAAKVHGLLGRDLVRKLTSSQSAHAAPGGVRMSVA